MNCLNNAGIQAVADGEAAEGARRHAATCPRCAARVREREIAMAGIASTLANGVDLPQPVRRRIDATLAAGWKPGATRIRDVPPRSPRQRAFWSGALAVAALFAILIGVPMINSPATVSASEILAASASRLAENSGGVELLEYELTLDGVPRELLPDQADGTYRVKQSIDHSRPGRFRFTSYAPDGRLLSSIAQDPATRHRVTLIRVEDQTYRFEFSLPDHARVSLRDMERVHMQASIGMMQARGNQHLQVLETGAGKVYRIEVPRVTEGSPSTVWDLTEAQAVIDADDYRVLELSVKGAFLERPYSLSFRLIDRAVKAPEDVDASEFEVPGEPDAIIVHGEGTAVPLRDMLVLALRELARVRQQQ
jgi:hypothetical protein